MSPPQKVAPLLWSSATNPATLCFPTPHIRLVMLQSCAQMPVLGQAPSPFPGWPPGPFPGDPSASPHSPDGSLTATSLPSTSLHFLLALKPGTRSALRTFPCHPVCLFSESCVPSPEVTSQPPAPSQPHCWLTFLRCLFPGHSCWNARHPPSRLSWLVPAGAKGFIQAFLPEPLPCPSRS